MTDMRRYRTILALLTALAALAACEKPVTLDNPLGLYQTAINLPAEAGTQYITVVASGDWTASLSKDISWGRLTVASGSGLSRAKFIFDRNRGLPREVTVVITDGERTVSQKLTQKGASAAKFALGREVVSLPSANLQVRIPVITTLEGELDRLTYTITDNEGYPAHWITDLTVDAKWLIFNMTPTGEPRAALIRLNLAGEFSASLQVMQTADEPLVSIPAFVLSNLSAAGGTFILPVQTNLESFETELMHSASIFSGWARVTGSSETGIRVELDANRTGQDRRCELRLSWDDRSGATTTWIFNLFQSGTLPDE